MKIRIHFSDGAFSYTRAEDDLNSRCQHEVEVLPEIVALWDAISQAVSEMQRQLCALDNAWYAARSADDDRCQ